MSLPMRSAVIGLAFTLVLAASHRVGAQDGRAGEVPKRQISAESFQAVPETFPAEGISAEGVRSMFIAGPEWKGKPTRIFAWYGVPPEAANGKVPAMVLIHGGGGTAFDRWVKVWNARGYAAIAIDTCGCVPVGTYGNWQRHEHGGPPGWDTSFSQLDDAITDQWTYHAVVGAGLAHSLIRSFPEVDAERTGVTGISWGGYLTSIVAGVDQRYKFAVPVYGCGFLGENSAWLPAFEKLGPEKAKLWLDQWDPSVYLPHATMPVLWVNGTNDFAYPLDSWKKSSQLPKSDRTLCLRIRMPHGHGSAGENPEEIRVFADSLLKGGKPLPRITSQKLDGDQLVVSFETTVSVPKAELCYTKATGRWQDREWLSIPAEVDGNAGRVTVAIPADATTFYINLFDERDCVVSSEHIERAGKSSP
ncbi:MAG: acetylxylan esterase [Planctomycetaceae bacterium]|nr:acetylxylan esterase [Planctomycetaceae bacterium]